MRQARFQPSPPSHSSARVGTPARGRSWANQRSSVGAQAVWVGTRFVASKEAGAPKAHKEAVLSASYEDAVTTLIYTGRPLRVRRTPYVDDW